MWFIDMVGVFIRKARHIKPRSQGYWIQLFSATKIKGDPPKQILIDCCYWDVDSVISDKSYNEGFTEDDIFENVGRGI